MIYPYRVGSIYSLLFFFFEEFLAPSLLLLRGNEAARHIGMLMSSYGQSIRSYGICSLLLLARERRLETSVMLVGMIDVMACVSRSMASLSLSCARE